MPATAAFWTISKLTRPETRRTRSWSGRRPARSSAPTSLSSALCRPTSSRSVTSSPSGVNRPEACRPPVVGERALRRAEASGQREEDRPVHDRPAGRQRVAAHDDLVDGRLAADPATGGRHEVALGDPRGVERPARAGRATMSSGWASARRVADLDARRPRRPDSIRPSVRRKPDGELRLGAGRPHRDGDRDRLLARPGGPDLHRLLAGERVGPLLDRRSAHGEDLRARDVAVGQGRRERWVVGRRHARSLCCGRDDRADPHPRAVALPRRGAAGDPGHDRRRRPAPARADLLRPLGRSGDRGAHRSTRRSTRSRSGRPTRSPSPGRATSWPARR